MPSSTPHPDLADLPPVLVECESCDRVVQATVLAESFYYEPSEGPPERWRFVRCMDNLHPMLVLQNEFGGMPRGFDDDPPWRAYPPQDKMLSYLIPPALREEHDQVRKCFKVKAYGASVVMSGRVLEGVCAEFGVRRGSLETRLKEMEKRGHLNNQLAEWSHMLRGVRNAGAHFGHMKVEREDALDAIAFSEALLDHLFVLKHRFEQLQVRRPLPKVVAAEVSADAPLSRRAQRRAKREQRAAQQGQVAEANVGSTEVNSENPTPKRPEAESTAPTGEDV